MASQGRADGAVRRATRPVVRARRRQPLQYNASRSIDGDAMTGSDSPTARPGRALPPPSATVPISLVNGFLASAGVQHDIVERYLREAGIPAELRSEPHARVTEEQFSTLYRTLAIELDDEMPGIFSRPLRGGTLKYLCLSLLDARNLETAQHRFGQFFHILLDDFFVESKRDGLVAQVLLRPNPAVGPIGALGQELMLKLVHGVCSWLIGQRIPLLQIEFACPRPRHAVDHLYFFSGPVQFDCERTLMRFSADYLDAPIRQSKRNLRKFLARAPGDWIFETFSEQRVCHRVRQYLSEALPDLPVIEQAAEHLHCSVRTLSRHLAAEGTTFQALKDELRRDIAIQRLTDTQDTIAAIGADIGFDDPSAFHRAFRHWTGSTPGTYRRRA
ncbi:AraC family transcriptional regulator [Burkholderia multivorans]|uniref:AraC family transcriptional regulator n=1 Tax=Burkholderia multivorans TaxID=87883 RepID=UPI00057F7DF1|nr:AraC family transcriptional regulator [Burkholderia multivorans]KHS09703.1 AraC family transcriptional regulator [Burkholderia multivorans]KHS09756.1 AraC family transcriptional regulator [Burkholderia multivorans]KPJ32649.1 AraC family transcriptional regulator [Burkholderia multivorans]KVT39972.1 AraC family transcriptional regulator [Burkholderia multivorans]MBR7900070.1 AraC family transcriptional regulator [Burkholderia multivorans]